MKDNVKNKKIYYQVAFAIGALVVLVSIFSYEITGGLSIGKTGQLALTIPIPETNIFIDQSKKIVTEKENEVLEISLSPKEHTIIVSHEDFYPWKKEIRISKDEKINLSPIFVYRNPSGNIITKNDPEYSKILNDIISNVTPQKNSPKKSLDGLVSVWAEDDKIMSKKDGDIKEVVKFQTPIRNLDFYKDRNDVVMFSSGNGVYVIELNKEGTQNFMPIYKGENPSFFTADKNYIFIQDFQNLMQVII